MTKRRSKYLQRCWFIKELVSGSTDPEHHLAFIVFWPVMSGRHFLTIPQYFNEIAHNLYLDLFLQNTLKLWIMVSAAGSHTSFFFYISSPLAPSSGKWSSIKLEKPH